MNTVAAHDRQKRYADQHRREEKLCVGEGVAVHRTPADIRRASYILARKLFKRDWPVPN